MSTYHVAVHVTLKSSVADPQGQAVQDALHHLSYESVESVRVGKLLHLHCQGDSETDVRAQVDTMCQQLLANPVIENYHLEITEQATA